MAKNSFAGSITTLDGKRIEGTVSVDSKSSLLVSPKSGSSPTRVEMANVLQAQMDFAMDEIAMSRGVVLSDGAALAAATFQRADADTIKLVPAMMSAEVTIKTVRVARLVFGSFSSAALANVPSGASGVLLESGDFVEGEFGGLENGKIKTSSVLFGIQAFEAGRPAKAVILRDAKPPIGQVVVRLLDGSVLPADSITLDRAATQIGKTPFGTITVPFEQIAQITAGGDRVVSLNSLTPVTGKATSGSVPAGMGLRGSSNTGTSRILQSPQNALTYDLAGEYDSLLGEVGVPSNFVPMRAIRIVVLGDGKALFRSDELTSVDDAVSVSINVQSVKTLMLQIEPADGSQSSAPAALWVDPILVRSVGRKS